MLFVIFFWLLFINFFIFYFISWIFK